MMKLSPVAFLATGFFAGSSIGLSQTNIFPSSGSVGVGTTTPQTTLHVAGVFRVGSSSGNSGVDVSYVDGGWATIQEDVSRYGLNRSWRVGSASGMKQMMLLWGAGDSKAYSTKLSFYENESGGETVRINAWGDTFFSGGNVGIGTATPTAKTHIVSNSGGIVDLLRLQSAYGAVGDGGNIVWNDFTRDYVRLRSVVEGAAQVGLAIDTFSGGAISEKFRVSTSGNVGVGTASPVAKLDVNGGAHVGNGSANVSNTANGLSVQDNSGTPVALAVGKSTPQSVGLVWYDGTPNGSAVLYTFGNAAPLTVTAATGSLETAGTRRLFVDAAGSVGIGTSSPGSNKLAVNGTIRAKEVVVETTGWSDYVFADNYELKPLSEVEQHIKEHKHLPGIPSAKEVAEKGISLGQMQAKLLAKIEELTLHQIEQEKHQQAQDRIIQEQSARITTLERENNTLRSR